MPLPAGFSHYTISESVDIKHGFEDRIYLHRPPMLLRRGKIAALFLGDRIVQPAPTVERFPWKFLRRTSATESVWTREGNGYFRRRAELDAPEEAAVVVTNAGQLGLVRQ